jgi:hypothetical protein
VDNATLWCKGSSSRRRHCNKGGSKHGHSHCALREECEAIFRSISTRGQATDRQVVKTRDFRVLAVCRFKLERELKYWKHIRGNNLRGAFLYTLHDLNEFTKYGWWDWEYSGLVVWRLAVWIQS